MLSGIFCNIIKDNGKTEYSSKWGEEMYNQESNKCIFCGSDVVYSRDLSHVLSIDCYNCGRYSITYEANEDLPYNLKRELKGKKHLISGYLREMSDLVLKTEVITNSNYKNLLSNSKIPNTISEKLDKLLLFIYRKTEFLYQDIIVDYKQPATAYAKDETELRNMVGALESLDYIKRTNQFEPFTYILTLAGFEKAESMEKQAISSRQAFVAMWFNDFMQNIYDGYISKAIEDAGYKPLIISAKEHNGKICDNIIAEIRKSKFLIADFTGQRGGVYYEAGFAHGLGLPVIWTCRKDWFDGFVEKDVIAVIDGIEDKIRIKEKSSPHFDIRQYNFIVWETGEELYEKLKNRILATIV